MHLRMDFIDIQPFERSELCACFDVYNYLDAELKQYKDIQRSYCVFDIVRNPSSILRNDWKTLNIA